jgi:hypothetical protein
MEAMTISQDGSCQLIAPPEPGLELPADKRHPGMARESGTVRIGNRHPEYVPTRSEKDRTCKQLAIPLSIPGVGIRQIDPGIAELVIRKKGGSGLEGGEQLLHGKDPPMIYPVSQTDQKCSFTSGTGALHHRNTGEKAPDR